ncbi:hypothetical protein SAMN02745181_3459 [Rubritalea squalenifaciens DSM 18772]|uniref:Uncharacterized protein n=1 Tax=Rubritalea squalenifaciens DSM 18772 TaxID=1123071 RepID=A0A1M6QP92_9BACT|nr:hypothetical protein [Rubritalea squalenifaciens]SHK21958.1 hypothetical protein SAMN02745181_3459 [Rubritalea squalenifaciens DSM 18772]
MHFLRTLTLLLLSLTTLSHGEERPAISLDAPEGRPGIYAHYFSLTMIYYGGKNAHFKIILKNPTPDTQYIRCNKEIFLGGIHGTTKDGKKIRLYQKPYITHLLTGIFMPDRFPFDKNQSLTWKVPVDSLVHLDGHSLGDEWRKLKPEELEGATLTADLNCLGLVNNRHRYLHSTNNAALRSTPITIPKP